MTQQVKITGDDAGLGRFISAGFIPSSMTASGENLVFGGQLGYDHQLDWVVLGIEADFQRINYKAGQTLIFNPFQTSLNSHEARLDALGTLRGRVGAALAPTLMAYVTAGLAYGKAGVSATSSITSFPCVGVFNFCGSGSNDAWLFGWTVGGGMKYAVTGNWSLKAEYIYYDLGSISVLTKDPRASHDPLFINFITPFNGYIVRVGIDYKF
jgi:outer membrane immunogenic protein